MLSAEMHLYIGSFWFCSHVWEESSFTRMLLNSASKQLEQFSVLKWRVQQPTQQKPQYKH